MEIDLKGVIGEAYGDGGIQHGSLLVAYAESILGNDQENLINSRLALQSAIGDAGLVDAAAIAATFNAIDRVADGTGIPIDEERLAPTAEFRKKLGIDTFPSRQQ